MTPKFSVLNIRNIPNKMSSLSIALLISFISEQKKSIRKGKNNYKSGHVKPLSNKATVFYVHASMKKKDYKVTVS